MNTTKKAAKHLAEIASYLEILGENKFRVRSFSTASRSLEHFSGSLEDALAAAQAGELRGFGEQLAALLAEMVESGSSQLHCELVEKLGSGFLEILGISGVGAKKAKVLRDELSIETIEALEQACRNGSLASVKGFGKKTVDNYLAAIERVKQLRGYVLLNQAQGLHEALQEQLDTTLLATGALVRGFEISDHLEFIVPDSSFEKTTQLVNKHLVEEKTSSARVLTQTENELCLEQKSHTRLSFYAFSESAMPRMMFLKSAHPEHIQALREQAEECGENFDALLECLDAAEANTSTVEAETELYQALQLPFIPPELREESSLEELADILRDAKVVAPDACTGIVHAHSTYSDGQASLKELAEYVRGCGFQYLGISDHSQTAAYAGGLRPDDILRQHDEIDSLNESLAPFVILKGIESDILSDGSLDYSDAVLESFDFVIASLHSKLNASRDETYQRLKRAIENPYTTSIGHITTRKLLQRDEAEMDLNGLLELAAEHSVAVEINANPRRLDLPFAFHQRAKALGVLLPVCPDAHSLEGIHDIRYGLSIARKGGLSAEDIPTCWPAKRAISFWSHSKRS